MLFTCSCLYPFKRKDTIVRIFLLLSVENEGFCLPPRNTPMRLHFIQLINESIIISSSLRPTASSRRRGEESHQQAAGPNHQEGRPGDGGRLRQLCRLHRRLQGQRRGPHPALQVNTQNTRTAPGSD